MKEAIAMDLSYVKIEECPPAKILSKHHSKLPAQFLADRFHRLDFISVSSFLEEGRIWFDLDNFYLCTSNAPHKVRVVVLHSAIDVDLKS